MSLRWLSGTPLVSALVLSVLLAGCGGPSVAPAAGGGPSQGVAGPRSPFPPRPTALRLEGIDPCQLLTPAQRGQLGVELLSLQGADVFDGNGKDCEWGRTSAPHDGYSASTDLRRPADYALTSQTGTQVTEVGGYGAVLTTGGTADPTTNCVALIDIAPGQSLWASYDDSFHDQPALTHEVACTKAITVAEMMVDNLRGLVR